MKSSLLPLDRLGLKISTASKELDWIKSHERHFKGQLARHGQAAELRWIENDHAAIRSLRNKIRRMNRRLTKLETESGS